MLAQSSLSRAAEAAGVPARFHYWRGRSGRRYLFTEADAAGVDDFAEGVLIAAVGGRIVWICDVAGVTILPAALARGAHLSVHLLAASDEERRGVIDDLCPDERLPLRLAA